MSEYRGRRVFRRPRWHRIATNISAGLIIVAAYFTQQARGWDWLSVIATALAILSPLAIVETYRERVILEDEALRIVRLFREERYARTDIVSATQYKGTLPIVVLRDGTAINLPDIGQAISNSIRAWLKHAPPTP